MNKTPFLQVFADELLSKLPGSELYAGQQGELSKSRERAIACSSENGRSEFIVVVRHSSLPKFTVEVAWSEFGRFPRVSPRPCFDFPDSELRYPEYVFRLRCGRVKAECWWRIPESDDIEGMRGLVQQVVGLLREQASPFLPIFFQ